MKNNAQITQSAVGDQILRYGVIPKSDSGGKARSAWDQFLGERVGQLPDPAWACPGGFTTLCVLKGDSESSSTDSLVESAQLLARSKAVEPKVVCGIHVDTPLHHVFAVMYSGVPAVEPTFTIVPGNERCIYAYGRTPGKDPQKAMSWLSSLVLGPDTLIADLSWQPHGDSRNPESTARNLSPSTASTCVIPGGLQVCLCLRNPKWMTVVQGPAMKRLKGTMRLTVAVSGFTNNDLRLNHALQVLQEYVEAQCPANLEPIATASKMTIGSIGEAKDSKDSKDKFAERFSVEAEKAAVGTMVIGHCAANAGDMTYVSVLIKDKTPEPAQLRALHMEGGKGFGLEVPGGVVVTLIHEEGRGCFHDMMGPTGAGTFVPGVHLKEVGGGKYEIVASKGI